MSARVDRVVAWLRTFDPAAGPVASAFRALVGGIDPNVPVGRVTTIDRLMADATAEPRFNTALVSAPTTNPSCTLIVSHACWPPLKLHSAASCGTTAVAENHSAIASSSASASSHRFRQGSDMRARVV